MAEIIGLKMKISIVSPAYNAEKFIMRVFNNLRPLLGTYIHKWIIVDDCSIDETEKIISKLALQHESVEYLRLEKNSGPAEARYKGIEKVKTDIFMFFDIDDYLYTENFVKFTEFIASNRNVDFWYAPLEHISDYNKIDKNKIFRVERIHKINKSTDFILYGFPQPSSLAMTKEFALNVMDTKGISWGEDIYMYLRAINQGQGLRWEKAISCYIVNGEGRGSLLRLRGRIELILYLFKLVFREKIKISNIIFLGYISLRTIASYLYKKNFLYFKK